MRVGVVIPSYNHERYVADAVHSVLGQSIDAVELVVVDDGSSDNSPAIIREVFAQYPGRKTTLIEQPNAGAHAAIKRGIDQLDAEIIAVLNSDDTYELDRLEHVLPAIADREHALAFTKLKIFDDDSNPLAENHGWTKWYALALSAIESEPTIGFALMVHNFSVTSGNFVFTKSLYNKLGGFGNQQFAHDWDFLIRSIWYTEPVLIDKELMSYRVHDSNTTDRVRSLLKEECGGTIKQYLNMCAQMGPPANTQAPCPTHWQHYFDRFVQTRKAFWDPSHPKPHPIGLISSK